MNSALQKTSWCSFNLVQRLFPLLRERPPGWPSAGPYLEFFCKGGGGGGVPDIVSLFSRGGGRGRDNTYKSVIVTLSDHWGATAPPPPPPARYGPGHVAPRVWVAINVHARLF